MRFRWSSLGVFVALLLSACAPSGPQPSNTTRVDSASSQSTQNETRATEQKLTVGVKGLFGNPTPQSSATLHPIYFPLYDNLTALVGDFEVKPSVAEKWELRPDGSAWRFTIRKDMTWPDGTKLTADDVAFTLDTVLKLKWPQQPYFANVSGATKVDDYTVDFELKQADMSIPAAANFLWIIPKAYYEKVGFEGFVAKPVGSGPYELVSFNNADQVSFKKRSQPHAFRKPIADTITFKVIGENSQLINGLRTGEIDIVSDVNFTADQADTMKNEGMSLHVGHSTLQYMALPQGVAKLRDTPFQNKKVRQALMYAIDRKGMANGLYKSYATPAISVAVPGTPYFDPSIKVPEYDPAKAKQMLAEAGYPNGFKLPAGLDYNTAFTSQDEIVAIQANLKAIGLEFEVTPNERAVAVDKAYGRNNLQKGDIWVARQGDPLGFGGSRTFIGCGKPIGDASANYWCNPEWDSLMDQAYAEKDEAKRGQILKQAARLQADDAVYQALFVEPLFTVNRAKVRGVQLANDLYYNFDSAYIIN